MTDTADCDALFADMAEWNRCSKEDQTWLLALCGGMSGLTLLDTSLVAQNGAAPGQVVRLPYPVSLRSLMERLEYLRQGGKPGLKPPCTGTDPGNQDVSRPGQTESTHGTAYRRLLQEALAEAGQNEMSEGLDSLLSRLLTAVASSNPAVAERIAKISYDNYTESGAQACARFALALLMDTRRCSGSWLEELQNLVNTAHSRKVEV
jgi:hypothetical protein